MEEKKINAPKTNNKGAKAEEIANTIMDGIDKILKTAITLGMFYFFGFVINGVITSELFACNVLDMTIWSGQGLVFSLLAGLSALLVKKISNWMKE